MTERDVTGNWNKKLARQPNQRPYAPNSFRSGAIISKAKRITLVQADLNLTRKFSKFALYRASLEIGML